VDPAGTALERPKLAELASMWVAGQEVDWDGLHSGRKPERIALPKYPFARERYWLSGTTLPGDRQSSAAKLHPLISYNSSTLKTVSFDSLLSHTAFYAVDHRVRQERIFPGAGFLELACISGNIAGEHRVHKIKDIVWMRPLSFGNAPQLLRTVLKSAGDGAEYAIVSPDEERESAPYSEGKLVFRNDWAAATAQESIEIEALKAQCARVEEGADYYATLKKYGLSYGPSFQTIQKIHVGHTFALAKLKIADHLKGDFGQFILHPSIVDGAWQTLAVLAGGPDLVAPRLPFSLDEVDILHPVRQTCYALVEVADRERQNQPGVGKFNIKLLNESGDVLIRFANLLVRPFTGHEKKPHSPGEAAGMAAEKPAKIRNDVQFAEHRH
jgi:acyl transferase domain-containing protein